MHPHTAQQIAAERVADLHRTARPAAARPKPFVARGRIARRLRRLPVAGFMRVGAR